MEAFKRLDAAGYGMLACVIALAVAGLITAVSAAPPGDAWFTLARHCIFLGLGVAGFLAAFWLSTEATRKLVLPAIIGLFCFLWLMLLTPIGHTANSATRWVELGPITLQPSILFQCLWPIALASWVSRDPLRIRDWRQIAKLAGLFVVMMLPVLLQPDLGSVMILMVVSGVTFLFAGTPLRFLYVLIPALAITVWLAAMAFPHVASRLTYLDERPVQVVRGEEGFAVGGITGVGPGNGKLNLGFIPESETDFILPIVAEEWGMFGSIGILSLFLAFTLFGFRAARASSSRYGIILMASATVMISFQAAYNMAMVTNLVPVKGLPLPFVSRGGSSILALSALLGVALKAVYEGRRRPTPVTDLFS
ncbi:MAG: FtsW/RodA/SpoVE family cell cycle protein [Planctomycetota bacterium]|jgi:cell division protein FtsW (lipid II flippase)